VRHLGVRVLKTPPQSPQANALCERLAGTLRRECLDFSIPLTGDHLRCILQEWVQHYSAGRPHMALGPGIPQPLPQLPVLLQEHRHHIPAHLQYVFVAMEHVTRRILHTNVTAHPTTHWTMQRLRVAIPADHSYGFLIHDRDAIFSHELDQRVRNLGLRILKRLV
jgi:transposase